MREKSSDKCYEGEFDLYLSTYSVHATTFKGFFPFPPSFVKENK